MLEFAPVRSESLGDEPLRFGPGRDPLYGALAGVRVTRDRLRRLS